MFTNMLDLIQLVNKLINGTNKKIPSNIWKKLKITVAKCLIFLILPLKTNFSNNSTINCILDRNIIIVNKEGTPVTMFGVSKGDNMKVDLELGDIYNNLNYKWIVKKMTLLR